MYASIYKDVEEYLTEACNLTEPIIKILRFITDTYDNITFENIITLLHQIPHIQDYFVGGFEFQKHRLPYGKELHFRIVGIRDNREHLKYTWKFGQHTSVFSDSGSRKKRSPKKSKKMILLPSRVLSRKKKSSKKIIPPHKKKLSRKKKNHS